MYLECVKWDGELMEEKWKVVTTSCFTEEWETLKEWCVNNNTKMVEKQSIVGGIYLKGKEGCGFNSWVR